MLTDSLFYVPTYLREDVSKASDPCFSPPGGLQLRAKKPTVERDTPTSAVVNANQSPGMLAAVMAADLASTKAQESGPISIVSAYNT